MCGLVGFIRKKLKKSDSQLIRTMTNLLNHRGPDTQNYSKLINYKSVTQDYRLLINKRAINQ